jgi:hypothetical protein
MRAEAAGLAGSDEWGRLRAMGKNRVFFPQEALDRWLRAGQIEIAGAELTIRNKRRRYRLVEGVRVLAEVTSQPDPHELVGRVKTVAFLTELGAELLGASMVIGDNAYEVVPGWLGSPIGSFHEHRAELTALRSSDGSARAPGSDEELLADFLMRNL